MSSNTQNTRKFTNVSDQIVSVADVVRWQVHNPDGAQTVNVYYTIEDSVEATFDNGYNGGSLVSVTFADTNPDTIVRSAGNWEDDHFAVGMGITVGSSTSNNGTYTIAAIDGDTLTLIGGDTLVAEADSTGVTIDGLYTDAAIWALDQTVAVSSDAIGLLDPAPRAIRFTTSGTGIVVWVRS